MLYFFEDYLIHINNSNSQPLIDINMEHFNRLFSSKNNIFFDQVIIQLICEVLDEVQRIQLA